MNEMMKNNWIKTYAFVLFLFVVLSGCTATREQEIEGDVNEFRSWANMQTSRLEERTEEDWKNTKEEFRRRTSELDRQQDKFSEKIKADYQQIKEDFKARERERDKLSEQYSGLEQWRQDLLGQYASPAAVNAQNVKRVYVIFMDNVRAMHTTWGEQEWEKAGLVLEELNRRKDAFDELADEDEVQIKALQMEFTALQAGVSPAE